MTVKERSPSPVVLVPRVRAVPLVVVQVVAPAERRVRDAEEVERLVEEALPPRGRGNARRGQDLGQVQSQLEADQPLPVRNRRNEPVSLRAVRDGGQQEAGGTGFELEWSGEPRDLQ